MESIQFHMHTHYGMDSLKMDGSEWWLRLIRFKLFRMWNNIDTMWKASISPCVRQRVPLKKYQFFTLNWRKAVHEISTTVATTMAGTIKLFHTLQQFYIVFGLDSNPSRKYLIKAKILFFSFSITQMFVSSAAFFVSNAKPYSLEVGISFHALLTTLSVAVCTVDISWKMNEILMSIANYEEFIEKR